MNPLARYSKNNSCRGVLTPGRDVSPFVATTLGRRSRSPVTDRQTWARHRTPRHTVLVSTVPVSTVLVQTVRTGVLNDPRYLGLRLLHLYSMRRPLILLVVRKREDFGVALAVGISHRCSRSACPRSHQFRLKRPSGRNPSMSSIACFSNSVAKSSATFAPATFSPAAPADRSSNERFFLKASVGASAGWVPKPAFP